MTDCLLVTDWLAADGMTDYITDCVTDWMSNLQYQMLTNGATDWLTDCAIGYWTGWQNDWLSNWLTDWLTVQLGAWLADRMTDQVACVASVSVRFRIKERGTRVKICAKNGVSKRVGRGWEERKETLADKPLDFENHPLGLSSLSSRAYIWCCQQLS